MSERPYKRPKRSGDDTDRPDRSRDTRRDPRDRNANSRGGWDQERDSHRDRDRRNRSRSRERGDERDRNGGRGGQRDEGRDRERDGGYGRDGRGGGMRGDEREKGQDRDHRDSRGSARGGGDKEKNWERKRDRKRPREEDDDRRSRSPRRETARVTVEERSYEAHMAVPKDVVDETRSRTSTPPVVFKVQQPEKPATGPSSKRGTAPQATFDQGRGSTSVEPEVMDLEGPAAGKKNRKTRKSQKAAKALVDEDDDIVVEDDSMAAMQAMLGFGGFGSTHQKKVLGNDVSGVRKEKKTEYRQYMNRVGGFNRALSPTREP